MQVKNWCYGAFEATSMSEEIDSQIRLGHIYRNRLCELELERRAAVQDVVNDMCEEYVAACRAVTQAEESIEQIYADSRARRAKARSRMGLTDEERDQVKHLKESLRSLRRARKDAKQSAFSRPDVKAALDQTSAEHRENQREARKGSGLFWGTYLTVEDACKTFGQGAPPRFERFSGEGKIAVQIQKGADAEKIVNGTDTRLRLIVPEKGRHAEMMIRIGSEGRNPIFAKVPFIMHRPLPKNSRIKWAYLEKRKIASDTYWQLRLSIEMPNETRIPEKPEDVVVVHVGWRKVDGKIRVATIRGSDGHLEEVMIDRVGAFMLPDHLQGHRDQHFNEMKPKLLDWVSGLEEVPEFLQNIACVRSLRRMARIVDHWKKNRIAGDEEIVPVVELWRKRDKHLWLWQSHQRVKVRRWRRDVYRNIARRLANRYGFVSIVSAPWAELREKPTPDEDEVQTASMRRLSSIAAVADLEGCVKEAFGSDTLVEVDVAHISTDCHHCGFRNAIAGGPRYVKCKKCNWTWDVDQNGSINQLARAQVALKTMPSLAEIMRQRVRSDSNPLRVSKRQGKFRAAREAHANPLLKKGL